MLLSKNWSCLGALLILFLAGTIVMAKSAVQTTVPSAVQKSISSTKAQAGCCVGPIRGDINGNGGLSDVIDINYFVNYMFHGGPTPPCLEEADVDADGRVNVIDFNYLIAFYFSGGPAPKPCPA